MKSLIELGIEHLTIVIACLFSYLSLTLCLRIAYPRIYLWSWLSLSDLSSLWYRFTILSAWVSWSFWKVRFRDPCPYDSNIGTSCTNIM